MELTARPINGQTFGIDDAETAIACPVCGHKMSLDFVGTTGYFRDESDEPFRVRRTIRLDCICEARDDAPQV